MSEVDMEVFALFGLVVVLVVVNIIVGAIYMWVATRSGRGRR